MSTLIDYDHTHRPLSLFSINYTVTTNIYTLSLHDALRSVPSIGNSFINTMKNINHTRSSISDESPERKTSRSEERFSRNAETDLVCRLLLEKKNTVTQRL